MRWVSTLTLNMLISSSVSGARIGGRMLLLIDTDILLHRWAYANQFGIDWDDDGEFVEVMNPDRAVDEFDDDIQHLLKKSKCREYVCCISSEFNFRYKVLKTYKHNRTGDKPKLYDVLREHVQSTHPCKCWRNLEADDLLGILSTRSPGECVIASLDKDLDQIPGRHYNWNKDSLYQITPAYGDWWFLRQVLTGDATDGYKGCPKIGPKKAEKLLLEAFDGEAFNLRKGWDLVLSAYHKAKLTEEDALQQARVARILRVGEYNEHTKQPVLWHIDN